MPPTHKRPKSNDGERFQTSVPPLGFMAVNHARIAVCKFLCCDVRAFARDNPNLMVHGENRCCYKTYTTFGFIDRVKPLVLRPFPNALGVGRIYLLLSFKMRPP